MSALSRPAILVAVLSAACLVGGCMPGMTYRMPMPPSVTLGTQKSDQASMASSETRGRGTPVIQRTTPLGLE